MSDREQLLELARKISARGRGVPFPGPKDTAIAKAFLDAYWRPGRLDVQAEVTSESTLPTHVRHKASGDVAKVLAWHSKGYTADFGAGPEYVHELDVEALRGDDS